MCQEHNAKSFTSIISFNPWNNLTWKEPSSFNRCRNRFTEVKDLPKDAWLIKWQSQNASASRAFKNHYARSVPQVYDAYTEVPKSLLLGNAHRITTRYKLELEQQIFSVTILS